MGRMSPIQPKGRQQVVFTPEQLPRDAHGMPCDHSRGQWQGGHFFAHSIYSISKVETRTSPPTPDTDVVQQQTTT